MKVFITGATGLLGSHIAELLLADGHEVRALVRKTSDTSFLDKLGVEKIHASLETGDGLKEAVSGVDAVVHSAAVVKAKTPEGFHQVNAGGTQRLLDATIEHAPGVKRFVFISSMAAHGFGEGGAPRPLDAESNPVTHYGKSKLAAERIVKAKTDDVPITIIRPPAIYGPRDREMLAFFQIVKKRVVPFMGSGDNKLSLIYASDCARAVCLSLTKEHPSGSVYYVEDGNVYTQNDMVRHIEAAIGKKALAKFPVPLKLVTAAALGSELFGKVTNRAMMLTRDKVNELAEQQVCFPADQIREELGWKAQTQFPEGAKISVDWYRENGLL